MNNPNEGGYLQWALAPRYRIFMDLEIPFLFADRDLYELASAFFDAEALRKFLARYRPAFITAPLAAGGFPALIAAHPRYAPVFVDDTGALYADRTRFAAVVERYELRFVDPYRLGTQRFSGLEEAALRGYFGELERMAAIDPHISSVNQAAAIIDNLRGRHREALVRIDAVLEKDSRLARAHAIRADALLGMGDDELAARSYRKALRLSENEEERKAISRSLSVCHSRAEKFPAAYAALKQSVGEFNPEASYRDLYTLGVLAAASGEPEKAVEMFRYASWKVPPEEEEWRRRIEDHLLALESGE